VASAATWGRRLDTERLREAVVDWAHGLIAINQRRRAARPRLRAALLVVFALWLTTVTLLVVLAIPPGRWGDVNWFTLLWWTAFGVAGRRVHTGPRRAIELNSGTPAP
jgi:hypothetical protein